MDPAASLLPRKERPHLAIISDQPPGGCQQPWRVPTCPYPSLHHLQGNSAAPPGDGLQQDAVGLACAEHEAEVPGLGDGQREAMPGHQAAAQEALRIGHFWGGR